MSDLLFTIGDLVVFANILTLVLFIKLKCGSESTLWALILLSFFNSSMHVWGYFLKSKFGIYDAVFMQHLWYLSYSVFHVFALSFLLFIHRQKQIKASIFSLIVSGGFVIITMATISQYFSHTILEVKYPVVASMYQYCIPYVNICTAVSGFFALFAEKYSKRSFKC